MTNHPSAEAHGRSGGVSFHGQGWHRPSRPRIAIEAAKEAGLSGKDWEATNRAIPVEFRVPLASFLCGAWRQGTRRRLAETVRDAIERHAPVVAAGGGCMSFYVAGEIATRCKASRPEEIESVLVAAIERKGVVGRLESRAKMRRIIRAEVREAA